MTLEKIYKQLTKLTGHMKPGEKLEFISKYGYKHPKEFKDLSEEQLQSFLTLLMADSGVVKEEMQRRLAGYTVTRKANPKTVKDISFNFPGLTKE